MGCTVAEAQARVDSREFAEWVAWHGLEPRGDDRLDWLFARLYGTIEHIMSNRRWRVADYLLEWGPCELPSEDTLAAKLKTLFLGAKDRRKRK